MELSLTSLQPVAIWHGVVETCPVHTLDGLVTVDDLKHLTHQSAVLLSSILGRAEEHSAAQRSTRTHGCVCVCLCTCTQLCTCVHVCVCVCTDP